MRSVWVPISTHLDSNRSEGEVDSAGSDHPDLSPVTSLTNLSEPL